MRLLAVMLAALPSLALAQVPQLVGYQGRLLKSDGSPESGSVAIKFSIYDAGNGGSALWTEAQSLALSDGYYATQLGSVTAFPSNLFAGPNRYLEIEVGGTALAPRQQIAAVPFALVAAQANSVAGKVEATSITVAGTPLFDTGGKLNAQLDWSKLTGIPAGFADGIDDGLTSVSVQAPLTGNGTPGSALAIGKAGNSADGYLSSADFLAFSAKVDSGDARLSDARDPKPGSGNYVQNGTAAQTASFNVSGTGAVGTSLTVGGPVNRVKVGESAAIPVIVGGTGAGRSTGLYSGQATFPLQFAAQPAVLLTPHVPSNNGVTRCRLVTTGLSQAGWWCWVYTTDTAAEGVHWLAMEQGAFTVPTRSGASRKIMAGVFDSRAANCSSCMINFPQTFGATPVVYATVDESYDNSGPTTAKIVSMNTAGVTISTTHQGNPYVADRIHWVAVEPSASDPIVLGTRLLFAGAAQVTAETGTVTFPAQLAKMPATLQLTIEGGAATSVRDITNGPSATGFVYYHYTDTAGGGTAATRINWLAWVDQ